MKAIKRINGKYERNMNFKIYLKTIISYTWRNNYLNTYCIGGYYNTNTHQYIIDVLKFIIKFYKKKKKRLKLEQVYFTYEWMERVWHHTYNEWHQLFTVWLLVSTVINRSYSGVHTVAFVAICFIWCHR